MEAAITEGVLVDTLPPPRETALAPVERQLVRQMGSPFDLVPVEFKAALQRREDNRKVLIGWLRSLLVKGVDYGSIHVVAKSKCKDFERTGRCNNTRHYSKDCLFKAGAEKICGYLGVTATFPNLKMYEDLAVRGEKISTIILRCELYDSSNNMVGEGTGARSVAQDQRYGTDDINKSLKMAQKSAQIDATLRMAGLSEIFTQDIEDMTPVDETQPGRRQKQASAQQRADKEARPAKAAESWLAPVWARAKEAGMPVGKWKEALKNFGIDSEEKAEKAAPEDIHDFEVGISNWIRESEMYQAGVEAEPGGGVR